MSFNLNIHLLVSIFVISTVFVHGDFPYQAALIKDAKKFCSGALITNKVIITSATCVEGAFEVDVIVGTENILKKSIAAISTSIIIHPNYDAPNNDVALIKLPEALELSDRIQTIELPTHDSLGDILQLTGWTKFPQSIHNSDGELIDGNVNSVPDDECKLAHNFICVTPSVEAGVRVGDLGSPLVADGAFLVGTASIVNEFVTGCTRIFDHIEWINAMLDELN